jgi:outer membrane protein assembly factor BamD (BamD/ComL family)
MRKGNYEEAALYYDQLISDDPKSPFLLQAHIKTIDARLKSYAGPQYDPAGLEDAKKLIQKTMVTFPERDQATSEFLVKSLELIEQEMAAITYEHGEFYRKTGYPGAAELSYAEVRARWPKSPYADLAKKQLAVIAKTPRKEVLPSKIMTTPGAADPYSNGNTAGSMSSMGMMGMGGMGMGGMGGPSGP